MKKTVGTYQKKSSRIGFHTWNITYGLDDILTR